MEKRIYSINESGSVIECVGYLFNKDDVKTYDECPCFGTRVELNDGTKYYGLIDGIVNVERDGCLYLILVTNCQCKPTRPKHDVKLLTLLT